MLFQPCFQKPPAVEEGSSQGSAVLNCFSVLTAFWSSASEDIFVSIKKMETLKISHNRHIRCGMVPKHYLTLSLIQMLSDAPAADVFFSFENMVTKEENSQKEHFLLLSPCFQLYSIIVLSFKGSFQFILGMFSKSSAADLLYVSKA